ncbi:unnamed protein product [Lymnaea stagnalis]|uniref:BPL/LPL catalytic domain-containing protein n=1 Tax=Lymnaea stagnalis TaxID=6523 RepID=A0AAV2IIM3_LYMST
MLFLTLGNIVLYGMQWLYEIIRQRRYGQVMNRLLRTSSVIIQRTRKTDLRVTTLLNSTNQLSEKLELEDDFIRISSLVPLQEVDLSTWTSYTSYLEIHTKVATPEQNICLLMEAKRPKDLNKFVNKALKIPPAYRVHVLIHGCPIAWKTADPFGIILHCSFPGLLILTDAFGQDRLTLEEDLELVRLVSVITKGTPQKLVPQFSDQLSKTAEDKHEEKSVGSKHDIIKNDKEIAGTDAHFGIDIKDVTSKSVVQASSPLHQDRDFMDTEKETSFSVDDGSTDHSKGLCESSQANGSVHTPVPAWDDRNTAESTRPRHPTKPPNILVYCGLKDTARIFSGIRSTLEASINTDAYTVYHLSHEVMMSAPWSSSAALLIVSSCPQLRPEVEDKIIDYVVRHGGRLLSFNSSIDARFARKSPEEGIDGDRLVSFKYGDCDDVTTVRGRYYYSAVTEYSEVIISQDRGTRDHFENGGHMMDQHKKALVLKTFGEGTGVAVLSQLLLERDPAEYAADPSSFALLKRSNTDRLTVLREILTSLGIDTSPGVIPPLTPCLLLVRRVGLKETFLDSFKHRLKEDKVLKAQKISLKFVDSFDNSEINPGVLPVVTSLDCDIATQFFQLSQYWQNLKTSKLGQVVFYTDVITTTMTVFEGLLFSIPKDVGPIAIAGCQTSGKGRGGNSWLSPQGCAMFTLPVSLSVDSELGQRVSFLQHMVSVAVVKSVVTLPGYEDLDIKLKWPNDIYYGKEMKLGGVLVTSTVMGSEIYATIGCGFNVANSNPTICINDIIQMYNTSHPDLADLPPLSHSQLIARTITILEGLMQDFDKRGHEAFCQEYYKHWLHEGAKVTIQLDQPTHGEIAGLDEHGYLSVRTPDQGLLSVQPDGNSFDMMHNLIYVKSRT